MQATFQHFSFYPFVQALARFSVRFSATTTGNEIVRVQMTWWRRGIPNTYQTLPMEEAHKSLTHTQWQCVLTQQEEIHYIKYYFTLTDEKGRVSYVDCNGMSGKPGDEQTAFELLQTHSEDKIHVPAWAQGCVFYQIYPDSFGLELDASQEAVAHWHTAPSKDNYLGGTLRGIEQRIPYLKELGVECLYLTPIFESDFTHRYATTEYLKVDHRLGTEADLIHLVDALHQNGIRILLDGVFNHCGNHFAPFLDLQAKGAQSAYAGWFYPKRYPIELNAACYECVGDYPFMPRLNGSNPELREYVKKVLFYWLDTAHIDGWRFDVADELDESAVRYWRDAVKAKYPEALLLAETWHAAPMLVDGSKHFESAMNYLFRTALLDYFAKDCTNEATFLSRLEQMRMVYAPEVCSAMYNLLGSHDTARFLTHCGGEKWRLKLAMAFQMLFEGSPALYYGDEIGMMGQNDPFCRAGMAWDHMDEELLTAQKQLIGLRLTSPAVRKGSCRLSAKDGCVVLKRQWMEDTLYAIFNKQSVPVMLDLSEAHGKVDAQAHSVKIIKQGGNEYEIR